MRGERPSIMVMLAAYTEVPTIRQTMQAFHEALPEAQIIVINYKSAGGIYQIVIQALADLNCDGQIINENRRGKGNSMRHVRQQRWAFGREVLKSPVTRAQGRTKA